MSRAPALLSQAPAPYRPPAQASGFTTAAGVPIPAPSAAAAAPSFKTSFPPAPYELQQRLDASSSRGPSCVTDIIADLAECGAHYVLDIFSLDTLHGPLRRELGDWQSTIHLSHWDACAERSLLLKKATPLRSCAVRVSYTLAGAYLHLRCQTLASHLLVAPCMALLSEYFRMRGLHVYHRLPNVGEEETADSSLVPLKGEPHLNFMPDDLYRMLDDAKDPVRALDELFFGTPNFEKLSLPESLFVVLRAEESSVVPCRMFVRVWLFTDEHYKSNEKAMRNPSVDTVALIGQQEKQQQQQQDKVMMEEQQQQQQQHQEVAPTQQDVVAVVPGTPAAAMPPPSPQQQQQLSSPPVMSPFQQQQQQLPASSFNAASNTSLGTFFKRQRT